MQEPGFESLPSPLAAYRSAKVTIHYNQQSGYSDTGTITYMDEHWVELTKDSGERLLLPVLAIRLIKLLEPVKQDSDANILLRPADSQRETRQITRE